MIDDTKIFVWALRAQRNYRAMRIAFALFGLVAGCAIGRSSLTAPAAPAAKYVGPWERIALIDNSFTETERGLIIYGFDAWLLKLGDKNAHIRYGVIDHTTAESNASGHTIHIVRRKNMKDIRGCEDRAGVSVVGCFDSSTGRMLFAADSLNHTDFPHVASHELGHAMGLDDLFHDSPGTRVMEWRVDLAAPVPTDDDIAAFCRVNGCTKMPSEWEYL